MRPLAPSRVDACNPLLQAHPTWARDKHEGRGFHLSHLSPFGFSSPLRAPSRADPSGLGHAATIYSSVQGPPGVKTPTGGEDPFEPYCATPSIVADNWGGLFDGDGDNTVANSEHLDSDANKLRQYTLLDVVPVDALAISNNSCSRSATTFSGSPMTFPTSAPPHEIGRAHV